jgi:hypothetical protein
VIHCSYTVYTVKLEEGFVKGGTILGPEVDGHTERMGNGGKGVEKPCCR